MKLFLEDGEEDIDIFDEKNIKLEELRLKSETEFLNNYNERQKKEYLEDIKNANIFNDIKKTKEKNNSFLNKIKKTFGF